VAQPPALIGGYAVGAQTEGNSPNTVAIAVNSVKYLTDFLSSEGLSSDVSQIGVKEIRAFTTYLQHKRCFSNHPYSKAQQRGLSVHPYQYLCKVNTRQATLKLCCYLS